MIYSRQFSWLFFGELHELNEWLQRTGLLKTRNTRRTIIKRRVVMIKDNWDNFYNKKENCCLCVVRVVVNNGLKGHAKARPRG